MHTLDHVQAEPESEIQEEQVREARWSTSVKFREILTFLLRKASPDAFNPMILVFYFESSLYIIV
jgi:hypothetical protein